MADEYEMPVKVVDRRWWARGEDAPGSDTAASLKPSYVEELERKLADSEKQAQEYLGKQHPASHDMEVARARMRKELAKDAERSRRDVLASLLEVVDNLDRAIDAARKTTKTPRPGSGQAPRRGWGQETDAPDPLLQGVELVRQQFLSKLEGFGVTRIPTEGPSFDPLGHEQVKTAAG